MRRFKCNKNNRGLGMVPQCKRGAARGKIDKLGGPIEKRASKRVREQGGATCTQACRDGGHPAGAQGDGSEGELATAEDAAGFISKHTCYWVGTGGL